MAGLHCDGLAAAVAMTKGAAVAGRRTGSADAFGNIIVRWKF